MKNNIYIIMNKPLGYVCSAVSDSHKTVYQLLTPQLQNIVQGAKRSHRLHTIGRLDAETTGLLLFTTDGYFSHYLTSPENEIEKLYEVELRNIVEEEKQKQYINKVEKGIILPPEKKVGEEITSPGTLEFITNSKCHIKIREGKFHQVRRTFLALGNEVIKLTRLKLGSLTLPVEELPPGSYRNLTEEELLQLYPNYGN